MVRFWQVMEKINQKFIDQISALDLSFNYHGVDANIFMKILVSRDYDLINIFFLTINQSLNYFQ